MSQGQVIKSTGSWYWIKSVKGKTIPCRIRGKIRLKGMKVTNPIAVGDVVEYEVDQDGQGIIHDIIPRENYLIRYATKKKDHGHILAANIDQVVLIATLVFPRTSLGFIDRVLVAAESFRIPQVLVFNKSDLLDKAMEDQVEELREVYESIGVQFLLISATQSKDLEALKAALKDKLSLLAGHSGVGKSTILNRLAPEIIQQKVGEVSTFADKGIHTTTFAEMFEITPGTHVIDTPGIKEMGLIDIEEGEVSHFFPEMRAFLGACKFHNCSHTHEPGCAVVEALEQGELAASRYYSYLSILEGEDSYR